MNYCSSLCQRLWEFLLKCQVQSHHLTKYRGGIRREELMNSSLENQPKGSKLCNIFPCNTEHAVLTHWFSSFQKRKEECSARKRITPRFYGRKLPHKQPVHSSLFETGTTKWLGQFKILIKWELAYAIHMDS